VQWLEGLYRPDRYEYQMEVSRIGSVDARIAVKQQGAAGSALQVQQEGNR
jgi:GntR family transcriptional regulator